MILPIEIYGSTVLRKMSVDIDKSYEGLNEFISNMFDTMYNAEGVGLAAPQVGRNIRLFIIDATVMEDEYPEAAGFKKVFINARITQRFGETELFNEGCLSVPGIREDVSRTNSISIEYMDENFEKHTEDFTGIKARIIQHEYDHLDATLFVDKLSALKKKLLSRKLAGMAKGKFEASYRVKVSK